MFYGIGVFGGVVCVVMVVFDLDCFIGSVVIEGIGVNNGVLGGVIEVIVNVLIVVGMFVLCVLGWIEMMFGWIDDIGWDLCDVNCMCCIGGCVVLCWNIGDWCVMFSGVV